MSSCVRCGSNNVKAGALRSLLLKPEIQVRQMRCASCRNQWREGVKDAEAKSVGKESLATAEPAKVKGRQRK